MKNIYHILFSILLVFLFLPMIQEHLNVINVNPLKGVTYKTEKPKFTFDNCYEGKYQAQLEKYISENFGFKEIAIRLYNQYIWTCFKKTYNKSFQKGKDNWFYYHRACREFKGFEYRSHFKTREEAIANYEKNITMMCQLRGILKEYGIEFMTFMGPDKPFIYPEYLPNKDTISKPLRAFEYYSKRFDEIGFPNIEMTQWFKAMRDTISHPIMQTIDSHWGVSAVYGCDSLLKYLNSLNDFGIPEIKYGKAIKTNKKPSYEEKVLNMIFPIIKKNYNYKMDIKVMNNENTKKPRILFVGDSFIWAINDYLPLQDILSDIEIWYYNSTVHQGFNLNKKKKQDINALQSILKSDYVVFYSCGHQWHEGTYNFLEETLNEFGVTDSTTNHDREKVKKLLLRIEIENDSVWNNTLLSYSLSNGIGIEDVYEVEINNVINGNTLLKDIIEIDEESIFEYEVEKLIDSWRKNPKMMKSLEDKAMKKGKPLEVVIVEDARWVIKKNKK